MFSVFAVVRGCFVVTTSFVVCLAHLQQHERNLTVAVPFFTQQLWECSGMLDISVDILRFIATKEIKEHKLFGRHLKELRKWIKEVALEGKQEMIPHEDTAGPETPCAANLPTPEVLSRSDEFVCLQCLLSC